MWVIVKNPWCKGAAIRFSTKTLEGVLEPMRSSSGDAIDVDLSFLYIRWTTEKTRPEKLRKIS